MLICWGGTAYTAESPVDTMQQLARTGRITLGSRDQAIPLSYRGPDGKHIGYQMDICDRVVQALRQHLNLPELKVVTVPTTLANRFALLDNRSVDIDCGHNPIHPGAQRRALLAHPTYLAEIRVLVRAEHAGQLLDWLAGRQVGVVVGSTAVPSLRSLNLKINEVPGRNSGEVFDLLEQGRVDAIAFTASYLQAHRVEAPQPERFGYLDGVLQADPVGLMFRADDHALLALANDVLTGLRRSGELARLYDAWFMQTVPGLPLSLGLPPSEALKQLLAETGGQP